LGTILLKNGATLVHGLIFITKKEKNQHGELRLGEYGFEGKAKFIIL
jgi:hypothetical protein